jgi:proton glutamate symport protein
MSLTARVLMALALGTVVGLVLREYPTPAGLAIVGVIEPVGTLWVNAIRMTIVPLVVSLLIAGVASSSNIAAVRAIGLRTLITFVVLLVTCGAFALIVVPPMFTWLPVDAGTVASLRGSASPLPPPADLPAMSDWIVGIVPTNPIRAAADGALLPLVVFSLAFGLGLLSTAAERRAGVLVFIGGVGDTMMAVVGVVIALAPIGVFALMVPVVSRTGLAAAGALVYYVGVTIAAQTIFLALLYPMVVLAARIPALTFARAVLPAQAVAIASSSSLASLPALLEGADRRLRLPSNVTGVVLPLAVSTFKVGTPLLWLIAAVFLGHLYGVPLGPAQLLAVALTALLTSFSTPGVPHGWLLVISPLVVTMGIPAEGIGLLIAVDAVPDIFATTLNVTADMVAAAVVSRFRPSSGTA